MSEAHERWFPRTPASLSETHYFCVPRRAVLSSLQASSPRKGEGRGHFSLLAPRVFVEPAEQFLTKPISHSNAGPPPPPNNKIKRHLSSSYNGSSLSRSTARDSWASSLRQGLPTESLDRGLRLLCLGPSAPSSPAPPTLSSCPPFSRGTF